ncbi:hypothetical protein ACFLZW_02015 [Chloroflexota bacterium]
MFGRPGGIEIEYALTPLIDEISSLMLIGFVYLVLQAVGEGIYALVDIKDLVFDLSGLSEEDVEDGLEGV